MELLAIIVSGVLSFALGLLAAAYGARLGKALDARKELLEEMRNWIDKIQDFINLVYQNIQGGSELAYSNEDRASLTRYRLISTARWFGISKTFGSQKLFDVTQEFSKAVFYFEQMYYLEMIKLPHNDPTYEQKMTKFKALNDSITNLAENLHAIITEETLIGLPLWLVRKSERA